VPYTLASDEWGGHQVVMLFAALLLIGAVILPPVLFRRLRLPGRGGKD
jgi:hypothetical protein